MEILSWIFGLFDWYNASTEQTMMVFDAVIIIALVIAVGWVSTLKCDYYDEEEEGEEE